jgi:hypothetical protein
MNEINALGGPPSAAPISRPLRTPGGINSQPNFNNAAGDGSAAAPAIPVEQQFDNMVRQSQAAQGAGIPFPPIPGAQ